MDPDHTHEGRPKHEVCEPPQAPHGSLGDALYADARGVITASSFAAGLAQRDRATGAASPSVEGLFGWQVTWAEQAWRRLEAHGATLLALPVGSGKTFVACALARHFVRCFGGHVVLVAPARLRAMWAAVGERFGVAFAGTYSHRDASLGRLPRRGPGPRLWLVDEAHHFRHRHTLRTQELARAVVGEWTCMLSATPFNTDWSDVAALLQIVGALADGEDRPAWMMEAFHAIAVLGEEVILPQTSRARAQRRDATRGRATRPPVLVEREVCAYPLFQAPENSASETQGATDHVAALLQGIAASIWPAWVDGALYDASSLGRDLLWARLCSHPRALAKTLERLERYYHHCARPSGELLSRRLFRTLFGQGGPLQLLLPFAWPSGGNHDLVAQAARTEAIAQVQRLRGSLQRLLGTTDTKVEALEALLTRHLEGDRTPAAAVLFTQFADTAKVVAEALGGRWRVALLTGQCATIAGRSVSGARLLEALERDGAQALQAPGCGVRPLVVVCTDVARQGHNLQHAHVLVHLDLPWNPTTLIQREGRVARFGQQRTVRLVTVHPVGHEVVADYWARVRGALTKRAAGAEVLVAARAVLGVGVWSVGLEVVLDTVGGRAAGRTERGLVPIASARLAAVLRSGGCLVAGTGSAKGGHDRRVWALQQALLTLVRRYRGHPAWGDWMRRLAAARRDTEGVLPIGWLWLVEDLLARGLPREPEAGLLAAEALTTLLGRGPWNRTRCLTIESFDRNDKKFQWCLTIALAEPGCDVRDGRCEGPSAT